MEKNSLVLVLGARGLVGGGTMRALKNQGYTNILAPTHHELDLTHQESTLDYFKKNKPSYVFLSAAKVGGIHANNTFRADFILQNLLIITHTMEAAHLTKVKKLLFLGSSCIYPVNCPKPIKEESLLTGPLEPTNEPYGLAKIAGIKLAENFFRQYGDQFFSAMPTNLYGVGDNFHPENSHVIPGLIRRLYQAKKEKQEFFKIWGTGLPRREFLYVDDLARALVFLMEQDFSTLPQLINIGSGEEISIKDLAGLIAKKLNYQGKLIFDDHYPQGIMDKMLDSSKIRNLGWRPLVDLDQGLDLAINYFLQEIVHD